MDAVDEEGVVARHQLLDEVGELTTEEQLLQVWVDRWVVKWEAAISFAAVQMKLLLTDIVLILLQRQAFVI